MKPITLKRCLKGLKNLRASKHGTLDASAVAELDVAILQLEQCLTTEGEVEIDRDQSERALLAIARCLEVVTNLSELVRRFFDSD